VFIRFISRNNINYIKILAESSQIQGQQKQEPTDYLYAYSCNKSNIILSSYVHRIWIKIKRVVIKY
ncbi:MAG: hypothetical protein ACTHKJ_03060, partial [Candidatus Nitrosocosmicus sp.]